MKSVIVIISFILFSGLFAQTDKTLEGVKNIKVDVLLNNIDNILLPFSEITLKADVEIELQLADFSIADKLYQDSGHLDIIVDLFSYLSCNAISYSIDIYFSQYVMVISNKSTSGAITWRRCLNGILDYDNKEVILKKIKEIINGFIVEYQKQNSE